MIRPKIILIVDDDQDTRLIIKRALTKSNFYLIKEASNGISLKEKLKLFIPDLVILDIKLPGESGYELCMYIRDNLEFERVKIIAISGFSGGIGDSIMRALGADCFFQKPINSQRFVQTVSRILEDREQA